MADTLLYRVISSMPRLSLMCSSRQSNHNVSPMDWLLAIGTIGAIRVIGSLTTNHQSPTTNHYLHIFTGKFVRSHPFSNIYVGNLKSPRGYFLFSTWGRIISSEVSFHSSEVSFDSSEDFFILHVEISKYPRGNHFSPTQPRIDM